MLRADRALHRLLGARRFLRDDQLVVRHRLFVLLRQHRGVGELHQDAGTAGLRIGVGLRQLERALRGLAQRLERGVQGCLVLRGLRGIGAAAARAGEPGQRLIRERRLFLQRIERRDRLGIFAELHEARARPHLRLGRERRLRIVLRKGRELVRRLALPALVEREHRAVKDRAPDVLRRRLIDERLLRGLLLRRERRGILQRLLRRFFLLLVTRRAPPCIARRPRAARCSNDACGRGGSARADRTPG